MTESIFDQEKNYYVYEYVKDATTGEYTEHAGEIQAFVKGTNSMDACISNGFDDMNRYGANRIDDLDTFTDAIAKERKHLSKISKQLKTMTDERDAERDEFLKERPCPNGCGQLNEEFKCDNCGYGREHENTIKELDDLIQREKKEGNDTSELEGLRDVIKAATEAQDEKAKQLSSSVTDK